MLRSEMLFFQKKSEKSTPEKFSEIYFCAICMYFFRLVFYSIETAMLNLLTNPLLTTPANVHLPFTLQAKGPPESPCVQISESHIMVKQEKINTSPIQTAIHMNKQGNILF